MVDDSTGDPNRVVKEEIMVDACPDVFQCRNVVCTDLLISDEPLIDMNADHCIQVAEFDYCLWNKVAVKLTSKLIRQQVYDGDHVRGMLG